jgi:uncharacterized protein (DUF4415 family)
MATQRMKHEQAHKVRLTSAQKQRLEAMTDAKITEAAKSDPDNPPLTDDELALIARLKRGGRPKSANPKQPVTMRLDAEVVGWLRASGPGWQSRVNEMLRNSMGLDQPRGKKGAARPRGRRTSPIRRTPAAWRKA